MVDAVISDCLAYNNTQEEVNPEVVTIVQNMLEFQAKMRNKINEGKRQAEPGQKRAYYGGLFKELLTTVDSNFEKLSEIVKKA